MIVFCYKLFTTSMPLNGLISSNVVKVAAVLGIRFVIITAITTLFNVFNPYEWVVILCL